MERGTDHQGFKWAGRGEDRQGIRGHSRWQIAILLLGVVSLSNAQVVAKVRPYSVHSGLKNVVNGRESTLRRAQKKAIQKNLFVIEKGDGLSLYEIYGQNLYEAVPNFITCDLGLHTYHELFDATLRTIEAEGLSVRLKSMVRGFEVASSETYRKATTPAVKKAALANCAYFGVASSLLGVKPTVPAEALTLIDAELTKIKAHKALGPSAIFPYNLDYTQYVPRGHYDRTAALKSYFMTMMWFGNVPFAAERIEGGARFRNDLQILQATLIARDATKSPMDGDWKTIYEATALFSGTSNQLTPTQWIEIAKATFGGLTDSQISDTTKYSRFLSNLKALGPSAIVSKRKGDPATTEIQMRLMGQRAIPDSIILQDLSGDERPLPSGLDIMAVLGSQRAAEILDSDPKKYNPKNWKQYPEIRDALQRRFAALPATQWRANLYWRWLETLKTLLKPTKPGYPSFMRSSLWRDRNLNLSLASWTELRHDTILYGEQSGAEMGGEEPEMTKGYIEPNLELWSALIGLTNQTVNELTKRRLMTDGLRSQYADFSKFLEFCKAISIKELTGLRPTKDEYQRIWTLEGEVSSISMSALNTGLGEQTLAPDDLDMAVVADVHNAGNFALTEGVGHADRIYVVVPIEGKLYIARGAVMSYYEFLVPASNRMTDKRWKAIVGTPKAPPRPDWTRKMRIQ